MAVSLQAAVAANTTHTCPVVYLLGPWFQILTVSHSALYTAFQEGLSGRARVCCGNRQCPALRGVCTETCESGSRSESQAYRRSSASRNHQGREKKTWGIACWLSKLCLEVFQDIPALTVLAVVRHRDVLNPFRWWEL